MDNEGCLNVVLHKNIWKAKWIVGNFLNTFDSEQNKERNIKLSIDNLFRSPLWCFTVHCSAVVFIVYSYGPLIIDATEN